MASQHLPSLSWIPQTKLRPPHLHADLVARPQLIDRLTAAIQTRRLILVSAPAGYGKTTLLAAFVQQETDLPAAWLLLDEEENHVTRFLQALIVALQQLAPECGHLAQTALASLPSPGTEFRRIIGILVNEVLETLPDPFLLVLDDLHTVREPDVYLALDYLLSHMPRQMHLMAATRYDPPLALARLRANHHLAEIRIGDLRFNPDETRALLNDKMHLALTPRDLETLLGQTEGWITGLHLSAGSLGQLPLDQRSRFLAQLAQHSRHIFEFLAEEVLERQDARHRTFLLQTSILAVLSPSRCRAVTGRTDAPRLLADLYRRNLCLTDAGSTGEVGEPLYRYHALFREFLLRHLALEMPDLVPILHQRAAEVAQQPARRVNHYLAAQEWQKAAHWIEQVGHELIQEGAFETLLGWIERLSAEVTRERPRLLYFRGVIARQRGALVKAEGLLEQALAGFAAQGDEAGEGEALMDLANLYGARHDYRRQPEVIRQALTKSLPSHGRVQLLIIRAWHSLYQGNWAQVDADIEEAMRVTLASQDRAAFNILGLQLREALILLPDGLARLESYCRKALARFGDGMSRGISPIQAGAYTLLAAIHLFRGDLAQSEKHMKRAEHISAQLGGFVFIDLGIDIEHSLLCYAREAYGQLEQRWQARLPRIEALPAARQWLIPSSLFLGRAYLLQKRRADADAVFARMETELTPESLPEAHAAHAVMAALLALADRRYDQAEELLREVVHKEQKARHTRVFADARLLLAHLYLQTEQPDKAHPALASLLNDCKADGMPGFFLYEGKRIGAALLHFALDQGIQTGFARETLHRLGLDEQKTMPPQPLPIPHTDQTLTPREVEVLHLIAAGHSNHTIADQLVITERTVKSHVTNILRKLNVSSRTQAAAQARALGLL